MTARARRERIPLVALSDARISAPGGRPLFDGLDLELTTEHAAIVGRNGVGKSTLLSVLAGLTDVDAGRVVVTAKTCFVPQASSAEREAGDAPGSHGERRRLDLARARASGADVLLLDEPTEHLDEAGVAWLRAWLGEWRGGLLVVTHDRRLLQDFDEFLIARESGCRAFSGSLAALDAEMEREHLESEGRYTARLRRLADHEERTLHLARRRARKKRYGRCSELDRATPRIRLNQKRDAAQKYQGRITRVREERLAEVRAWSLASRRALDVRLDLELPVPVLGEPPSTPVLDAQGLSASAAGRCLFESLDLRMGRAHVGVVGGNGAGKTTLLEMLRGRRAPSNGRLVVELSRVGGIAQGAEDWRRDESLASVLSLEGSATTPDAVARLLVAHRFPLALAERPLRSLSPGERVRAALICLFHRSPALELLVLDEPSESLDLVGQRALARALRAWPGGWIVASHDRALLKESGTERMIELSTR